MKPKCDQCDSLRINGVYCHETGCPNSGKEYNYEDECWETPVDDDMYDDDDWAISLWESYQEGDSNG